MQIRVAFYSNWDDHVTLESAALLDTETGEVVVLEDHDNIHGLDICTRQYILDEDGNKFEVDFDEDGVLRVLRDDDYGDHQGGVG